MEATFVVIGGGIAGVSCVETLAFYEPDEPIILISESALVKTVTNLHAITQTLTNFDIEENPIRSLSNKYPNVQVLHDKLTEIKDNKLEIITATGIIIKYKYLCLSMGAIPKLIPQSSNNPYVIGIRDTDSVERFLSKLSLSKQIVVVGNGGIASELVYKIEKTNIHWVIKDKHITSTFIDPGAAEFLKHRLNKTSVSTEQAPLKRLRYENEPTIHKAGAALGPDWYKNLNIVGSLEDLLPECVKVHYESEIINISTFERLENPCEVTLSNGEIIPCDLIVSATGVQPQNDFKICTPIDLSEDNGIKVNEYMQTSIPNIFAAGDLCTANWEHAKQWFPMKLWTQARQMGCYSAKCMSSIYKNETILQDFCFELFTHTTKLFGYKVILLGLYNGQKLNGDYEILFRSTKDEEYIKFVLQDNRLQGVVLIGDTDLEEMCENLILNQIDLSVYKEDLLNPDIDIEDYFD